MQRETAALWELARAWRIRSDYPSDASVTESNCYEFLRQCVEASCNFCEVGYF